MAAESPENIITLYDIEAKAGVGPWSPNTWKARFALNYKGVAYKTVYISYPDIKSKMMELGAAPGYPNGSRGDLYTLPVIHDPKHGVTITDSWKICEHLDKHYPASDPSQQILPPGSQMLQRAFSLWHDQVLTDAIGDLACMDCPAQLDERGKEYFIRTRAEWWGKPLDTWVTDRPAQWEKVRKDYARLAQLYDQYAPGSSGWAMGGEGPTHADFNVAGTLIWSKKLNLAEGEGWDVLSKIDGGRWDRFLQKLAPYMSEQ
ncbi:hypothetical protein BKA62DRAFT_127557 [Auriculariales sp. MPI-PUGE-AT-0066]|nr:hypothetical protein BKA62DRAFT_127557 [Auriculariales sp. MPI-PUGE-AT-0066]